MQILYNQQEHSTQGALIEIYIYYYYCNTSCQTVPAKIQHFLLVNSERQFGKLLKQLIKWAPEDIIHRIYLVNLFGAIY